jgi:hypothetical protein
MSLFGLPETCYFQQLGKWGLAPFSNEINRIRRILKSDGQATTQNQESQSRSSSCKCESSQSETQENQDLRYEP